MPKQRGNSTGKGEPVENGESTGKERRKWTTAENDQILDYFISIISAGKEIEKPNAVAFYKKSLSILKLDNCTHNQLKNQAKNLKKKYSDTIQWKDQTGQGVLEEEGNTSFQEILRKKCPHFEKLDEIYGTKLSISPPFVHDNFLADADVTFPEYSASIQSMDHESHDAQDDIVEDITPATTRSVVAKRKLGPQNGMTMLSKSVEIRSELQKDKLSLDKEKWMDEKRWRDDNYELELKRLDQDRIIQERKLELEERKIQNDLELQKYKIDQEYKLKFELAKLNR